MSGPQSLLLVEDHADVREALSEFLFSEGYQVTGVETAEAAVEALEHRPYDALVTDFALPGRDGAWLVESARADGRLPRVGVVITAVPQDVHVEGVRVLRKPLDLGELLGILRGGDGVAERTHRIELVLYVAGPSDPSRRARDNLERVLQEYLPEDVRVAVVDLAAGISESAREDRIGRTPTLVKRWPEPPAWVAGDLAEPQALHDLLQAAGARRRTRNG